MLAHTHLLLGLALKAGLNVGLRGLCQLATGKDRDLGHETSFGGCLGQAENSFMACSVCRPVSCLPGSGDHPASISVLFLWLYLLVPLLKRVLLLKSITEQKTNAHICHTVLCHIPHLTPPLQYPIICKIQLEYLCGVTLDERNPFVLTGLQDSLVLALRGHRDS